MRHGATWLIAVAAVAVLQVALIASHRPWLDEWQALQLALQSPTIADLLENLRYEGHPPLWYLILRLIGSGISPYLTLRIACVVLATVAHALILFRSPFSRAERLLLSTGCFFLFEFFTLSRSLTLGVTMLIITVSLWRTRWVWLALALLPMCDFLFGALSGILLIRRWRERALWLPGVLLWLASAALATWCVVPAADVVPALERSGLIRDFMGFLSGLGILLVPLQWGDGGLLWNSNAPLSLGAPLGVLFLMFADSQVRGSSLDRAMFWSFVALTLVFSLLV
jgi:hypothetical protein